FSSWARIGSGSAPRPAESTASTARANSAAGRIRRMTECLTSRGQEGPTPSGYQGGGWGVEEKPRGPPRRCRDEWEAAIALDVGRATARIDSVGARGPALAARPGQPARFGRPGRLSSDVTDWRKAT